jgi:hypothetical protein
MDFVLRIYLLGLIGFVPHSDEAKMTVLLLDAREPHYTSDGHTIGTHHPVVVARAGGCEGDCLGEAEALSNIVVPERTTPEPADRLAALRDAVQRGGGWILDGSDLRLEGIGSGLVFHQGRTHEADSKSAEDRGLLPDGALTLEDFDLVASLGRFSPEAGAVDSDVFARPPKKGLIVARFEVDRGKVKTLRPAAFGASLGPLRFATAREHRPQVGRPETFAGAVVLEIPVSAATIQLLERRLTGEPSRAMRLSPLNVAGKPTVELLVANLPKESYDPQPPNPHASHDGHGSQRAWLDRHFELFYELSDHRPPVRQRPIPASHEADSALRLPLAKPNHGSPLLTALNLLDPKAVQTNIPLCIPAQYDPYPPN